MLYPESRILIFSKVPVPGAVKTRLAPAIGDENAATIHRFLTHRQIQMAVDAMCSPVELWCASDCDHPFFVECASQYGIELKQQQGNDLGERMFNAMQETLRECRSAVIIGSDVPSLEASDIADAFFFLNEEYDCVLSPMEDGGYGLIGLCHVTKELFRDIGWGTTTVMEETRQRMQTLDWNSYEFPVGWDLDRPEDLLRLAAWSLPREIRKIVELKQED